MKKQNMISDLKTSRTFFLNSSLCLTEEDSSFAPTDDMLTAAQQVAHVAHTIDWFMEPLKSGAAFNMDFEGFEKEIRSVQSLESAMKWLHGSYDAAIALLESMDEAAMAQPLPAGPIMGGLPKWSVIGALIEHTAHHRGALTVYSRLRGKTPKMPYGEM